MKDPNNRKRKQRECELKPPVTLTVHDLLAPVERAHGSLDKITRAHTHAVDVAVAADDSNLSDVINQGMFVLAASTLEVMLQEVMVYILQHFPEKMAHTQLKTKDAIGTILTSDLLASQAEGVVRSLMYKNIENILESFGKYTGIDASCFLADQVRRLGEIKHTRNDLLHGGQHRVEAAHLGDCLVTIKYFISDIGTKLRDKYAGYTRVKALKELWDFMFFNPRFALFDDFWEIDEHEDVVRMKDTPDAESRLAGSEQVFLAIWRNVLVGFGAPPLPKSFSFLKLDSSSRRKVAVFLACSARIGVLVNR